MKLALCIEAKRIPASLITSTLDELVDLNVATYRANRVTRAPWSYLWVPDQLVVCDGDACRLADTSKLQDVEIIDDNGQASCGSLACAYAAWLYVREAKSDAAVKLIPRGPGNWHVVAFADGSAYDPAVIGRRERQAASWR